MNTLPEGGRPLEEDPTGVRALLAGLPEPGPMPEDLVRRISASLAQEQRERSTATTVTRLQPLASAGPSAVEQPSRPAAAAVPAAAPADELAARRARRRTLSAVAGVAAAGALLFGGGYLLAQGDEDNVTAAPISTQSNSAAGKTAPARDVQVIASGKDYQASTFAADTASLKNGQVANDDQAMSQRTDAQAARRNPTTLAPCLKGLLDDLMAKPDAVTVDFARFEGQDAMIVVMDRDGKSTAWAVSASCTVNHPGVLSGPQPVAG